MRQFWRIFDRLLELMVMLVGILVFITAAVCYAIGMRFFFTKTTIWIMQATEYGLLWMVFLSTTWLLREKGHIISDVLVSHLSEKNRRYIDCIMFVVGGLACTVLAVFGTIYIYDCIVKGVTDVRAITVPKSPIFVIIPIGSILLTIQFFRMAWSTFIDIKIGR